MTEQLAYRDFWLTWSYSVVSRSAIQWDEVALAELEMTMVDGQTRYKRAGKPDSHHPGGTGPRLRRH